MNNEIFNQSQVIRCGKKLITLFPDQSLAMMEEETTTEREFFIGEKEFIVRSVFPTATSKTPFNTMMKWVELSGKSSE